MASSFLRPAIAALAITLLTCGVGAAQEEQNRQVITQQNWHQYAQYMPEGLKALFSGNYFWKFPADFQMVVTPTTEYRNPSLYEKDTEEYSRDVKIVDLPDGGHNISGYVAGLPFPNPQEPLR